jgi:hypothetical protein
MSNEHKIMRRALQEMYAEKAGCFCYKKIAVYPRRLYLSIVFSPFVTGGRLPRICSSATMLGKTKKLKNQTEHKKLPFIKPHTSTTIKKSLNTRKLQISEKVAQLTLEAKPSGGRGRAC